MLPRARQQTSTTTNCFKKATISEASQNEALIMTIPLVISKINLKSLQIETLLYFLLPQWKTLLTSVRISEVAKH